MTAGKERESNGEATKRDEGSGAMEVENNLKERTESGNLRRIDSLNLEAGKITSPRANAGHFDWKTTMVLAFQSLGIVYGDIGTSPLYVFSSIFQEGIQDKEDILGVLSLIFYTIVLVPLIKYVCIVLWCNDNGDGGTFAIYSLLCRYAKVGLIPNVQPEDRELSNYNLDTITSETKRAQRLKHKLENSKTAKISLFLITILGTSMVIGDGVLTPCISVLSAVSGIKALGQDAVTWISVAILILLFAVQKFGTDKVGVSFAPIILLWFAFISLIGLYDLFKYDIGVLRAINPMYIFDYFKRNGKDGWVSLGGVILCITGAEAMFADLGHFSVRSIQISFSGIVMPAILVAYSGQAAYLTKNPGDVADTFYAAVPGPLYWPTFLVAVLAAIIASQALISGAFSIIAQSLSLSCFPRVKVVHTSAKHEGQVYIPEINYLLMILCVIVTVTFKTTEHIGNAYGIAVVAVMVITTSMVTLVMLVVWKAKIWWILLFFVGFIVIESVYLSSVLYKFVQGGYLPLAFSLVLMTVMGIWHYVHTEKYRYELDNKVSGEYIKDLVTNPTVNRVPGVGLLCSELVQGIPPIFHHFVANIPSIHSVLVFVSIKSVPISKVLLEERFLFRRVEAREYRMFRCVARYGHREKTEEPQEFERRLVEQLKEFIRHEHIFNVAETAGQMSEPGVSTSSTRSFDAPLPEAEEETQFVQRAMEKGVVYLLGESEVTAKEGSSLLKKFVVNYAYSFLQKNFRQGQRLMQIPKSRLLRVGMTYEI